MNNVKSREHAHTCRKARAIFKLRYKKKDFSGKVVGAHVALISCLHDLIEQSGTIALSNDFGNFNLTDFIEWFAF